jgi:hypothetical protein
VYIHNPQNVIAIDARFDNMICAHPGDHASVAVKIEEGGCGMAKLRLYAKPQKAFR